MKIKKYEASKLKRIVTGMVVSTPVIAQIAAKWERGTFDSKWADIAGGWCVQYYHKYGKAIGKNIVAYFERWAAHYPNEQTVDLMNKFLRNLNDEYRTAKTGINAEHVIDEASEYLDQARTNKLAKLVAAYNERGRTDKAIEVIESFRRADIGLGSEVDVMQDRKAFFRAFDKQSDSLIHYPGALGQFFGPMLSRNSLIAFLGREKRGKTYWLIDVAYRAMLERRRVLFLQVGDLSEDEMELRWGARCAQVPIDPEEVRYPTKLRKRKGMAPLVKHKTKSFPKGLSRRQGWRAMRMIQRTMVKSKQSYFKLRCYPSMSLTVSQIDGIIADLIHRDWVPDIVIIDYADILAHDSSQRDYRHQTNETWAKLKGLTQKYHCLVVTATQSDTESYNVFTLEMKNFSEDKRKNAHVNGIVGLNGTEDETKLGLMRLNWVVRRRGPRISPRRCVIVAGCLALSSPAILSTW
jgi:hypothetical protein